jgi:hypothetical protein
VLPALLGADFFVNVNLFLFMPLILIVLSSPELELNGRMHVNRAGTVFPDSPALSWE